MTLIQMAGVPQQELKVRGIFDEDPAVTVFTQYQVVLQIRDKLMAGTPNDPKMIQGWLMSKMGLSDEQEIQEYLLKTVRENGGGDRVREGMTLAELQEIADDLAETRQTNVFRRDEIGLYIEDRQVKAGIKESVNILYAGERWGATSKGPKSLAAERIFIDHPRIYLTTPKDPEKYVRGEWKDGLSVLQSPSSTDLFIGHTSGPKGPQSNLTHVQTAFRPRLYFSLRVTEDAIDELAWKRIWVQFQELGLGSLRSQSFGRFSVLDFHKVAEGDRPRAKVAKPAKATKNGAAQEPVAVG
jgi:hypothetical protein